MQCGIIKHARYDAAQENAILCINNITRFKNKCSALEHRIIQ